ncbi:MAG: tetratricopeptide repeat protein [Verrucomicrobiota bacterium]
MVYLAYDLKRSEETLKLLTEYEALCASYQKNELIPAAIYYWLGQVHFEQKKFTQAITFFAAVNSHPQPGELRNPSWWYLAESQREAGLWKFAIVSYERFQKLDPEKSKSNEFLLALAQAYLGAKEWNECQKLAEAVMLQDPEGKSSAQARFLVAECHEGRKDYLAAAKAFAALAVLYQDPHWTPHSMHRASLAFAKAGDTGNAQIWSDKLQKAYPQFRK